MSALISLTNLNVVSLFPNGVSSVIGGEVIAKHWTHFETLLRFDSENGCCTAVGTKPARLQFCNYAILTFLMIFSYFLVHSHTISTDRSLTDVSQLCMNEGIL